MPQIPNKKELALPYLWEEMRTKASAQFAEVFLKKNVTDVIDNPRTLKQFGALSNPEKLAALSDAYTICLKDDDYEQAADLAGGIFYFLTVDPKMDKNIESAENFYEDVTIYGYRSMWVKLVEAAHEASADTSNTIGKSIVAKVRKRGMAELKEDFECIFIDHELRQEELEKSTFPIFISKILDTTIGQIVIALISAFGIIWLARAVGMLR